MEEHHLPPTVSAILPARDEEANIADAVASLAAQPELAEIIVVDDQSADATPEILAALAAHLPRLRVARTGNLPGGWVGKNYAAAMGARAASLANRWLLFTDADTRHMPGSLSTALQMADQHRAALVSFSPEQQMDTFWERALMPIVFCRLERRFSFDRVNDPDLPDAAANGQYLLIRRDAYDAVGGHAAVRGLALEDLALARLVKSAGYRIWFGPGQGIARTRMYSFFRAMWEGWTRNLYPLFGDTAGALASELAAPLAALIGLALLPGFLVSPAVAPSARWIAAAGLLILIAVHAQYALALRRNHYSLRLIKYYLPGILLFGAALLVSWWSNTRGAVAWKGRTYPARTP